MTSSPLDRLHTHDLELGATDAIQKHISRHVVPPRQVSQRRLDFERRRPRWLRECLAEATGVFFYVFPGISSVASFTLNATSPIGATAFGSLFQIGWSFALGITFAIITCAPTSGGHFNPAITIALCVWQGFPLRKVPYYIFSQILGAFIAGLIVMGIYWPQIQEMKAAFIAAGKPLVMNGGPASILCSFPNADQTNLGYVFMTEFFVCAFISVVIWACIDPANPFVSPVAAPILIGIGYGAMVWGFADITIGTNMARDLGTRMVAAIFFGKEAFNYMGYTPIAVLVNIPATLLATGYYEFLMRDSLLTINSGHAVHEGGEEGLMRHITKMTTAEGVEVEDSPVSSRSNNTKDS
ncbi:Aquaporin-3 [Cladobotryum mycophilum]|uniref:Aquaporin-3 n=1 Tax=Cladobotryum mycophilum TaxID=491253 RepID=A0ABR0SR85_9HYPO